MREILFRGMREYDNKFVYGDLVSPHNPYEKYYTIVMKNGCACQILNKKTILQFTGLQDKNGVKIFEGDIVRLYSGNASRIGEVKFGEIMVPSTTDLFESCEYVGYYIFVSENESYSLLGYDGVEVIGNIYDNPELLKEEEN